LVCGFIPDNGSTTRRGSSDFPAEALVPEVLDDLRAVVRVRELDDRLGNAAVAQDLRAIDDVRHDRVGADVGLEVVVRRRSPGAGSRRSTWPARLAEVVIVRADAREERVGADCARGLLARLAIARECS
jgi:hypothetical protein